MGRATIISGGDEGRYLIEMDYGLAQRDAKLAKLDALLASLADRRIFEQDQVDGLQGGLDSFQAQVNPLIEAYRAAMTLIVPLPGLADSIRQQLDALTGQIVKQQLWLAQATSALAQTDLQIKQVNLDRAALVAVDITEQRLAWCADLTEGASGPVGTIDIPGESSLFLIVPGAVPPVAADGAMAAREIMSPEQAFWNAAVLPGWQKFKPTYRWGTITALDEDADTCSVSLAPAVSSARALNVNQAESLSGVPIVYMDCNAEAFDVGNNVVVRFAGQDWSAPSVIGFLDHPRSCGISIQYSYPATSASPSFTTHTFRVPRGDDGPEVTTPASWGEITHGKFWQWDDGVTTRTRQDLNIQLAKQYTAQYCSMAMLYLSVRTLATVGTDTQVGLQLTAISDSGTYSPGGFYAHEVLDATFPTLGQAMAWRPSPVEVRRWVPALNRTFVMAYTFDVGLDRWVPPVDFAAGSFVGEYYPSWDSWPP